MSRIHVLVTGATGSVGLEVVRLLALGWPDVRVTCAIRGSSLQDLLHRWRKLIIVAQPDATMHRILKAFEPVIADVTEPSLSLCHSSLSALRTSLTHIIHTAAHVNFLGPLSTSRSINVVGTRNVLEFALTCPRLERVAHVSSLFIAGRRSGVIYERDLEHTAGFVSSYERSKYEAELAVHQYMARLPIAIYRLALLAGRAEDGYVHRPGALHLAMRHMVEGNLPILPGSPETRLDILPTDYTAEVLLRLFFHYFEASKTYHISRGRDAVRLRAVLGVLGRHSGPRKAWRFPQFVEAGRYEEWLKATMAASKSGKKLGLVMNTMLPHLFLPKIFDFTSVNDTAPHLPRIQNFEEYFPKIVERYFGTEGLPTDAPRLSHGALQSADWSWRSVRGKG